MINGNRITACLAFALALNCFFQSARAQTSFTQRGDSLFISFEGQPIFKAKLLSKKPTKAVHQSKTLGGAAQEIIVLSSDAPFELFGTITADEDALCVESDPDDRAIKIVKNTVGVSQNTMNNAVYNRQKDWLLGIDKDPYYTHIRTQKNTTTPSLGGSTFDIYTRASIAIIRFKPNYYQRHRGLSYFTPKPRLFTPPLVGWSSWYSFFNKVTEGDIIEVTDLLAEKLKPYGLEYIQIDDGFQQLPIGKPEHWINSNSQFPRGMTFMADYIKKKGLKPGIWTNVAVADSAYAFEHKSLFVLDEHHLPARGKWVDYVMNGNHPETISTLIHPVYTTLRKQGWSYFKLDALRHLKYEGYNSHPDFFRQTKTDPNEAFRNIVKAVRSSIGSDVPLLACWGIRPELVGIVDACRIGDDGYRYAGLAQYNSYNNIVWRNDPDHIQLSEKEAYRSCVATSLAGALFMLTDKPKTYHTPIIEAAIRSIPVLYTQPVQVFDVDPSRSSTIHLADAELCGAGPRGLDASSSTTTGLFLLELNRPFEHWSVLGRLDEKEPVLPFRDMGLNEQKKYLVFEFWTKQFRGIHSKKFEPGALDPKFNCQVFCFREQQNHPQILATNRHISCGGVDLANVSWEKNTLAGKSEIVPIENYVLYIYEPSSHRYLSVECDNAQVVSSTSNGTMRTIELKPKSNAKTLHWKIRYQ